MEESQERVLAGSRDIFLKYTHCRNVYMEILQKGAAIALVSVAGSEDGLQLSVAITLLMAATSGMVQPFLQPQARKQPANQHAATVQTYPQSHNTKFMTFCSQESFLFILNFACSTPGDQRSPMLLLFVLGSGVGELQLSNGLVPWQFLLAP